MTHFHTLTSNIGSQNVHVLISGADVHCQDQASSIFCWTRLMLCVPDVFVKFSPSRMHHHYNMILEQKYVYSYIECSAAHSFPTIHCLLAVRGIKCACLNIHTYITICKLVKRYLYYMHFYFIAGTLPFTMKQCLLILFVKKFISTLINSDL